MTLYIIAPPDSDQLVQVTSIDAKLVNASVEISVLPVDSDPYKQVAQLATVNFKSGDIVCMAGVCVRQTTIGIAETAISTKINLMPGCGVDHRGVEIEAGKINSRSVIEKNHSTAWPYVMIIGNPEAARLSFELLPHMDSAAYWPNYVPEPDDIQLQHLLSAVSMTGLWETPNWFKIVDLSVRDLELAPVMYASHMWHDWIAFYPANGNFKLENHAQLMPVWMAGSVKPLEYW